MLFPLPISAAPFHVHVPPCHSNLFLPSPRLPFCPAPGTASFSAFGVFDGHGGKGAPTYASKNLLPLTARYLDRCKGEEPELPQPPACEALQVTEEQRRGWAVQEALIDRLPKVCGCGCA